MYNFRLPLQLALSTIIGNFVWSWLTGETIPGRAWFGDAACIAVGCGYGWYCCSRQFRDGIRNYLASLPRKT